MTADPLLVAWHYLPEMPEMGIEVILAYKYDENPIMAKWNGNNWIGSSNTRDYMNDGYVNDPCLVVTEYIYAWSYLPKNPPVPEPF